MSERIEIDAEPRADIPVNLVGVEYTIRPPKGSTAIAMAKQARQAEKSDDEDSALKSWELIEDWVSKAFGKKKAGEIQKRLDDPDDELDVPHLSQLISKVSEQMTGNPTT